MNESVNNSERYVVGVDFGTLSGRALVVRVSDGAEVGTAVHEYRNGVIDTTLPATGQALPPDWALQDPDDYREVLRHAVRQALAQAGVAPRRWSASASTSPPARCCRPAATGRRCARWPSPDPPARVREAVEAPRRPVPRRPHQRPGPRARRVVDRPVRRQDLLRVGVRQGAAGAGGGSRDLPAGAALDRGRRLDRVAALRSRDPQRRHRRLQGHPPGRPVPVPGVPGRPQPGFRRRRRQARAPAVPVR